MTSPLPSKAENKRLYDECYKHLRAQAKLEEWQQEEKDRSHRRMTLQRFQADRADRSLQRYASTSCHELCAKMFEVLPREMRDAIYQHILPAAPIAMNIIERDRTSCRCGSCREGRYCNGFGLWNPGHLLKHLLNTAYVPREFIRELLDQLYRTNIFDFNNDLRGIARFRMEHAGTGDIMPINYPLNIAMCVKCQLYHFDGLKTTVTFQRRDPIPQNDLLVDLEALSGFKTGTKIFVDLQINQDHLQGTPNKEAWLCDTVVPFILPTMRRLAVFGTKVKLGFGKNGCILVINDGNITMEQIKEQFAKVRKRETKVSETPS